MGNIVEILWTGGWDSTFRILELSRTDAEIQPYYIIDPQRRSTKWELSAMGKISRALRKRMTDPDRLRDTAVLRREDIRPNAEVTRAYERLKPLTQLGSQYDWLARFALDHPGVELSLEKSPVSKAFLALQRFGELEEVGRTETSWRLRPETPSTDLGIIFGSYTFPIIDRTKKDFEAQVREWKMLPVMKLTWFCHQPVAGQPCGQCNPCVSTMAEHLVFRFPFASRLRHGLRGSVWMNRLVNLQRRADRWLEARRPAR